MEHRWIDGHLDLACLALLGHDLRREADDDCERCVSLPALRQAGVTLAFATIFTHPKAGEPAGYDGPDDLDGAERAGFEQVEIYERLEAEGELSIVRHLGDLNADEGPLPKIVLLMEGADPIRSPAHARAWHDRGLRLVGLTWAAGTRYASGNSESGGGVTGAGRELIAALDELGLVHDASHLNDAALADLLAHARGPIVATHSNCRALMAENERHLTDTQIRMVADRGGIIGLNLYRKFLAEGRHATVADCAAHLQHVVEVLGRHDAVALGSDMDGGFGPADLPQGIEHPTHLDAIAAELASRGWTADEVAGFQSRNWSRFLTRAFASPST